DCSAVGDVARQDTDLEGQRSQYVRAVDGTSLGEEIDDAEIGKCEHGAKDHGDHDDRRDDGENDLVVAPPEAGAINGCGVEHVVRYRGKSGEENNHYERKQAPG